MTTILWNDTTREARYEAITNALAAGHNVYVMTGLRAIKATPKAAAKRIHRAAVQGAG